MLYALFCEDIDNSLPLRQQVRTAHLERLQALRDEGRLVLAGPHPAIESNNPGDAGFTGSLVVAEFDSLEDAKRWGDNDPYMQAGIFKSVHIKPFKRVF